MRQHVGWFSNKRKAKEYNLGLPLTLEPNLEYFLGEPAVTQEAEWGCDLSQEPSVENYEVWLELRGCHLDTPDWWEELVAIPNVDDHCRLAWMV